MSVERRFDLDGVALDVQVESPALAEVLVQQLRGWSVEAKPAAQGPPGRPIRLVIGEGASPEAPARAPRFSFPPMRGYAQDAQSGGTGGWLLRDDVGHLDVRPEAGTIEGAVQPGLDARRLVQFSMVTVGVALLECLRARRRYSIHAAGLIDPAGDLVLLIGRSGTAKTTAAVNLLQAGWRALGDDVVFLEPDGQGGLSTIAHRRHFLLDEHLLARCPRLRRHVHRRPEHEPQDKQVLNVEQAFPGQVLRRWGAPARIFFPELTAGPRSYIAPLSPREALLRLFPHSCFVVVKPELTPGHLGTLGVLVDNAPAARLFCGSDLLASPGGYPDLLAARPWLNAISA